MPIPEVRDLYRVPPADFVAARALLVKALRAAGRKDDARVVVKLRKPTVPAWALNQVAAEQPELIEAALAAGDGLEAATARTLGGDASGLREATAAQQAAAAAVVAAAASHEPGLTAEQRDRMAATLRAAIVDDEVRARLRAGTLDADHAAPVGFGDAPAAAPAPAPAPARRKGSAAAELAAPPATKRKVRRVGSPSSGTRPPVPADEVEAKRRAREREQARERAKERAALERAAKAARAQADKLEAAAAKAEAAAAEARARADQAEADAQAAEDAVNQVPEVGRTDEG